MILTYYMRNFQLVDGQQVRIKYDGKSDVPYKSHYLITVFLLFIVFSSALSCHL